MRSVCLLLTLLSHLFILLPGDEDSPGFLDDPGERVKLPLPHLLQKKQLRNTEHVKVCMYMFSRIYLHFTIYVLMASVIFHLLFLGI